MTISDLIDRAGKYLDGLDSNRLRDAYLFAKEAHKGQFRKSGEPYIIHPLGVALLLLDYKADEDSLVAALLHDVVEDTDSTLKDIEKEFGKEVSAIVSALTKLRGPKDLSNADLYHYDAKVESIRKIFEVMEDDVRVIIIKLCDRLHNIQSLHYFRPEKQRRIAQQTVDIYAKIAHRLSVLHLEEQLKAFSFQFLYPERYEKFLEAKKENTPLFLSDQSTVKRKLSSDEFQQKKYNVHFHQDVSFDELLRPVASEPEFSTDVYLVVPNIQDCYLALRCVHSLWNNVRGSVFDYISIPQSNGYRALETLVVRSNGRVLKFIIQTKEMYEYARFGLALKCFGKLAADKKIQLSWVKNLNQLHKDTKEKSQDYLNALEHDILRTAIIVYTDGDRTVTLPPRSTVLDAAFAQHGKRAYKLFSASANDKDVLFSHHLQDKDRLSFDFSRRDSVTHNWLRYVQTAYSKSFIFEYLRELPFRKKQSIAEEMLQDELTEIDFGYLDEISEKKKQKVARKLGLSSWNELLESIAEGTFEVPLVSALLFDKQEIMKKRFSSDVLIKRVGSADSLGKIFSYCDENDIHYTHYSTNKYDGFFIDRMHFDWSLYQKTGFYSFIKEFLHFSITELKSIQKGILPYLYLLAIPIFWSINTFVSRYIMAEGLTPANATELRFLSSAAILFLMAQVRCVSQHEEYSWLHFKPLFFLVTGVLILYQYLIHFSLFHTESINYIVPVSISFVLVALLPLFKQKQGIRRLVLPIALCALSMFFLFGQELTSSRSIGIIVGLIVFVLHMTYNYYGNIYQKKYKIKSRGMFLLAFSFIFASAFFIPFLDFQNFYEVPLEVLGIAVLNGFLTGGLAHFFFFETSKYLQHYKLTLAMTAMVALTFVLGAFLEGSGNPYTLMASVCMISALGVASWLEYRKQGTLDTVRHLV